MLDEKKVTKLIAEAQLSMIESRALFGKEIYQKRFKPVYEGYITALCSVIESSDDEKTELIKGVKE